MRDAKGSPETRSGAEEMPQERRTVHDESFDDILTWLLEQSEVCRPDPWKGPETVIEAASRCLGWLVRGSRLPSQTAWDLVTAHDGSERDVESIRRQVLYFMSMENDLAYLTSRIIRLIRDGLMVIEGQSIPGFMDTAQALGLAFRLFNVAWAVKEAPAEEAESRDI